MAKHIGWWGPPTSTIDWCEENYIVTTYVAEFFNSASSFLIFFAGLLPLMHSHLWHLIEPRFAVAFASVCVVGLGSVAFHGTLQFRHQMWDEVPMLWTVNILLYVLIEHHTKKPRFGMALPVGFSLYAGFATYATSQNDGNVQWFSFHTLFAACEFPALFLVYRFFRGLEPNEVELRTMLMRGFTAYIVAIVLWLTDLNFCHVLRQFPAYDYWNLHSFGWHLFTSCGLYSMMLGIWYHRLKCILKVDVVLAGGLVPRLELKGGRM